MSEPTLLSALLRSLLTQGQPDVDVMRALERLDAEVGRPASGVPFLTVLLRTQFRRPETLRDALLSLAAQTDRDFEVLVVGHDVAGEAHAALLALVEQYAPLLPAPAGVHFVDGGTRAVPLNVGLSRARGEYVSVLDDDDVVFAHWIETFHDASARSGGRLLRATTATQRIEPETWSAGRRGFRTLSWPFAEYETTFDQLRHLLVNRTPFMSVAFPRTMFSRFGIRADESLVVCEDWDLILRGAFLLGVTDVEEMTSVYRRWQGGASSYSEHDAEAWRRSEERVRAKLDATPLLIPPGQVERIRAHVDSEGTREALHAVVSSLSWRVTEPLRAFRRRITVWRRRLRRR